MIAGAARAQVSKQLKLRPEHEAPMIEPFLRFGNTSSSSTWCAAGALGHGGPLSPVRGCRRCLCTCCISIGPAQDCAAHWRYAQVLCGLPSWLAAASSRNAVSGPSCQNLSQHSQPLVSAFGDRLPAPAGTRGAMWRAGRACAAATGSGSCHLAAASSATAPPGPRCATATSRCRILEHLMHE